MMPWQISLPGAVDPATLRADPKGFEGEPLPTAWLYYLQALRDHPEVTTDPGQVELQVAQARFLFVTHKVCWAEDRANDESGYEQSPQQNKLIHRAHSFVVR